MLVVAGTHPLYGRGIWTGSGAAVAALLLVIVTGWYSYGDMATGFTSRIWAVTNPTGRVFIKDYALCLVIGLLVAEIIRPSGPAWLYWNGVVVGMGFTCSYLWPAFRQSVKSPPVHIPAPRKTIHDS